MLALLYAADGDFLRGSNMDSNCLIEELLIYSIPPPEETSTDLRLTHADHAATYDKRMDTTIEDDDVVLLQCRDHFTLDTIEEVCCLEKYSCFRNNSLIYFFERIIGFEKFPKDWSCLP